MRRVLLAAALISVGASAAWAERFTYVNPGDTEWCRDPRATEWIKMQWSRDANRTSRSVVSNPAYWDKGPATALRAIDGEKIIALEDMAAASYTCAGSVPGMCHPMPKRHACHAMVTQRNGYRTGVTFFVDDDTGEVSTQTDAQRKIAGD